jgi:hypothetical protein
VTATKGLAPAPAPLTTLQPLDDLVVDAVDSRGEVLVGGLGTAVADDDIAIGDSLSALKGPLRPARRGLRALLKVAARCPLWSA